MLEEGWQSKCDLTRPLSNRNSYDKDLFVGTYQAFASHIGETTLKKHILEMFLLRCLYAPRSASSWFLKTAALRREVLTDAYLTTFTRFETIE